MALCPVKACSRDGNSPEGDFIMVERFIIHVEAFTFFRYEKPTVFRSRINWEKGMDIYNEDMANRINFIMRKNRTDPYPGTN